MSATLNHARVSTAIRLAKNFDYKQHGRGLSIRADRKVDIEHVRTANILSVKESTATGKVPPTFEQMRKSAAQAHHHNEPVLASSRGTIIDQQDARALKSHFGGGGPMHQGRSLTNGHSWAQRPFVRKQHPVTKQFERPSVWIQARGLALTRLVLVGFFQRTLILDR